LLIGKLHDAGYKEGRTVRKHHNPKPAQPSPE
jgi:hypothetical protein